MGDWETRNIEEISIKSRPYIPDVLCHFTLDGYAYTLQNRLADQNDSSSDWMPVAVTHRYSLISCPFCEKKGKHQFICPTLSEKDVMISLDAYLKKHHQVRLQWLFLS